MREAREVIEAALKANEIDMVPCDRCDGRGYHHGFGEHGHDPDWCVKCDGAQTVHSGVEPPDAILTALSSAGLAVVPVDTALLTEADLIKVRDLADELHVAFKETDKERFTAGELAAVKISALMFSRVLQAGVRAGERARAAALPPLASGGG